MTKLWPCGAGMAWKRETWAGKPVAQALSASSAAGAARARIFLARDIGWWPFENGDYTLYRSAYPNIIVAEWLLNGDESSQRPIVNHRAWYAAASVGRARMADGAHPRSRIHSNSAGWPTRPLSTDPYG